MRPASPSSSTASAFPSTSSDWRGGWTPLAERSTAPQSTCSRRVRGSLFYGQFFRQLGFCNPDTDRLTAFGGLELAPLGDGVQQPPAGTGSVTFAADATGLTAGLPRSPPPPPGPHPAPPPLRQAAGHPI